ncbi:MAG: hypothetical protein J6031_02005 [Bacteroidales bacterium]|nr:hypothetical protein [Bacteroidales bacterium]
MKKIVILLSLLTVVSFTQAQIGGVIGKKLKEKAEQTLNNALGSKGQEKTDNQSNKPSTEIDDGADELTPEKIISMVPVMPNPQQLAEYLCETHRANQRTLKILANPTTTYLSQLSVAGVSGYASLMGSNGYGQYYNFDEQLLKEFGITSEQYEAMSEEQQQEIALKYAAEMQDRYYKTIERLGKDDGYMKMMEEYNAVEDQIAKIYSDADSTCNDYWQKKYGSKENPNEDDMCSYYRQVVPTYFQQVVKAMNLRKNQQLAIAKKIDTYVQTLAKRYPNEVYAGLYSQSYICATAYVTDASRITTLSDPR